MLSNSGFCPFGVSRNRSTLRLFNIDEAVLYISKNCGAQIKTYNPTHFHLKHLPGAPATCEIVVSCHAPGEQDGTDRGASDFREIRLSSFKRAEVAMDRSLLTVIRPDISITATKCKVHVDAPVCPWSGGYSYLPVRGCWWSQIAFPPAHTTQCRERQSAGVTGRCQGGVSQETGQENLGFCGNLDGVKWETKCPFLKIAGTKLQGFLPQCPCGQFTTPVTSLPLLPMLPFSNPVCLVQR